MPNLLSLVFAVIAILCAIAVLSDKARAGMYTTTYTTADGRVIVCTTITDFYGNPINVNCVGG